MAITLKPVNKPANPTNEPSSIPPESVGDITIDSSVQDQQEPVTEATSASAIETKTASVITEVPSTVELIAETVEPIPTSFNVKLALAFIEDYGRKMSPLYYNPTTGRAMQKELLNFYKKWVQEMSIDDQRQVGHALITAFNDKDNFAFTSQQMTRFLAETAASNEQFEFFTQMNIVLQRLADGQKDRINLNQLSPMITDSFRTYLLTH